VSDANTTPALELLAAGTGGAAASSAQSEVKVSANAAAVSVGFEVRGMVGVGRELEATAGFAGVCSGTAEAYTPYPHPHRQSNKVVALDGKKLRGITTGMAAVMACMTVLALGGAERKRKLGRSAAQPEPHTH
jgi:hypothetical protein